MSGFDASASFKTFGLALVGYLLVLAVGVSIGLSIGDEGFTGLGIIALTTVVAAPLGAVVGSYVGLRRFGRPGGERVGLRIVGVVLAIAVILTLLVDPPAQFMVPPLGISLALILRSGVGAAPAQSIPEEPPAV